MCSNMKSMMTSHATTKLAMEGRTAPAFFNKLVLDCCLLIHCYLFIDSRAARAQEKLCGFEVDACADIEPWRYKDVASRPQRTQESRRLDIESTCCQYEFAALGRKLATNGRRLDQTVHDKY